jgi:lysine-specific histone demethylase 1
MGAYSFMAVGSSGEDYDLLAEPLSNRLFFAGEATNRYHPSTTAGAYLSGLRAAREIALSCSGLPFDLNKPATP